MGGGGSSSSRGGRGKCASDRVFGVIIFEKSAIKPVI